MFDTGDLSTHLASAGSQTFNSTSDGLTPTPTPNPTPPPPTPLPAPAPTSQSRTTQPPSKATKDGNQSTYWNQIPTPTGDNGTHDEVQHRGSRMWIVGAAIGGAALAGLGAFGIFWAIFMRSPPENGRLWWSHTSTNA